MVGLLVGLQPRHAVRSNRESGRGRYDVMIAPRTPGQPGVVIELKVPDRRRRETLQTAMTAALRQIRDRDYAAELRACGADPIHEMGIVFDANQVLVRVARPPKSKVARRPAAGSSLTGKSTRGKPVSKRAAAPVRSASKKNKAPRR